MTKLSIVIVNYNAGSFLVECLSSLENVRSEVSFDIWGVDNASRDNRLELAEKKFPNVKYIKNDDNLGFGKANNVALRQIKTEYILLLNPDSEVSSGTLKYMVEYM